MRRVFVLFFVFVLSMLLCACGHEHTWLDATCETPKTCSGCGATEGAALGHDWIEASCSGPKTCSRCGVTEGEALSHVWLDATCTEPKTCSVCGATEGDPLGHDWNEATFFEPKTCARCAETEGDRLLYDLTDSAFTDGYELAEFSRFNSLASENGLGGTLIWFEGRLESVITMDLPDVKKGLTAFNSLFRDTDGNVWVVTLDLNEYTSIEKFQELCGHQFVVLGKYNGLSQVYNLPNILLERMFDRTTGSVIASIWYTKLS